MRRRTVWCGLVLCLNYLLPSAAFSQQPGQQAAQANTRAQTTYKFEANAEIVLVNVTVHDSKGNLVRDLKKGDVTVLEDGKPQQIRSFEFEDVDRGLETAGNAVTGGASETVIAGAGPVKPAPAPAAANNGAKSSPTPAAADTDSAYRDRRLVVMYFDLTTMQPEDVQSAVESADNYVKKQMLPADLVAIAALGNSLQVVEDFTSNKDILLRDLDNLNPASSAGFADGLEADATTGAVDTDLTADDGNSFVADDTEFNVANADRSLEALMTIAEMLAPIQQKKSLLFFSDGITRSGTDNELTLRSAVNAAVKGNVSIYSVDARGLIAQVPGGSAQSGSLRGSSVYTGASSVSALNGQYASQETLQNLSNDTGGAFFLDSNDFAPAYTKLQDDTRAYYLISYSSSNAAKDGKYRKIAVKLNRPDLNGAKVDARKGYFAPTDINHMNKADRQGQLEDQLDSDNPDQTLDIYAASGYLRLPPGTAGRGRGRGSETYDRFFVPVSVVIPGNELPLAGPNPKATPSVDFAGFVEDNGLRQIAHMNDDVPLTVKTVGDTKVLATKNLEYNAGFVLTPGLYHIRMAARENQIGQMGSFEEILTIPDLTKPPAPTALETSSILLGSQFATVKPEADNPLTSTGHELLLSVTRVFSINQPLDMYFEVYDPKPGPDGKYDVHASVAFYSGKVRVFATPPVVKTELSDARRGAITFELQIPLSDIKPGPYTLQVDVIDNNAQKFAFPHVPVLLRAAPPPAGSAAPPAAGGSQP